MELNDTYTWLWGIIGVAWLFVEGAAVKNKNPGDTFTEHVRKIIGFDPNAPWMLTPRKIILGIAMALGYLHFGHGI